MPFRKHKVFGATRVTVLFAFCSVLISLVVLCGWIVDKSMLTSFGPGWKRMNISTALGTLSAAIALLLINRRMHKNAGVILSSLVLLLGFVLLAESLLGLNYHIDDLFTTVKMAGDETVANQ